MAFEPIFSIGNTSTCKAINLFDTTGAYNSSSNPNGWGAPNPTIASITAATFNIQNTSGMNATINVFNTFPTTDSSLAFPIINTDAGLNSTDCFKGIYTGTYTAFVNTTTYSSTANFFADYVYRCCLKELKSKLHSCGSCNKDELAWKIARVSALIDAIHEALDPSCDKDPNAMLKELDNLCSSCNCGG